MALNTLTIPCTRATYSGAAGVESIAVILAGGAPRVRRDVLGAYWRMRVTWAVESADYATLFAFYRDNLALPFLFDLIVESASPTLHKCYFVPATFRVSPPDGPMVVDADLFVNPSVYTP